MLCYAGVASEEETALPSRHVIHMGCREPFVVLQEPRLASFTLCATERNQQLWGHKLCVRLSFQDLDKFA